MLARLIRIVGNFTLFHEGADSAGYFFQCVETEILILVPFQLVPANPFENTLCSRSRCLDRHSAQIVGTALVFQQGHGVANGHAKIRATKAAHNGKGHANHLAIAD